LSSGVDGVSHVAEEVKNPKTAIPKSMIWGTLINAIMAFGYAFTALYCTGDYEEALTGVTGYPVIQIAYQASGSNLAATYVLMALVILPSWVALCNSFASVNRLT
jgi:amino acid transporter